MIFVTLDITRAIGLETAIKDLKIVCLYRNPLTKALQEKGVPVFCAEEEGIRVEKNSTHTLLQQEQVQKWIETQESSPEILVFKPTAKIETLLKEKNWKPINSDAKLNVRYEDKISFHNICKELSLPIPKTQVVSLNDLNWDTIEGIGRKAVLQLRRGHAGESSFIITSKEDLSNLKEHLHGNHTVKLTQFLEGRTLTINTLITENEVETGFLMEQITGVEGLNASKLGTCGVHVFLDEPLPKKLKDNIETLAKHMKENGYRGVFGVDAIEEKNGNIAFIECNARLTATISFHTQLAHRKNEHGNYASQIIIRNTKDKGVKLIHDLQSGIYELKDNKLTHINDSIHLDDLQKDQALLLIKPHGSEIKSGIEIAYIQSFSKLINKNTLSPILNKLQDSIQYQSPYIAPEDFWEERYAKVKKTTDVLTKPLGEYAHIKPRAIHRNRQTQLLSIEPTVKLLGEYEGYYLIEKYDGTRGWVWKSLIEESQKEDGIIKSTTDEEFHEHWNEKPYLWGGMSEEGIDCSGLVQRYFLQVHNIKLPKHSRNQKNHGKKIEKQDLKEGDIVFLTHREKGTAHVGIYRNKKIFHACLKNKKVQEETAEEMEKEYEFQEYRRVLSR